MKKILTCVTILIGTFIGAGFASGREVAIFFSQFHEKGLCGIVVSACLFGVITYHVLKKMIKKPEESLQDFMGHSSFFMLMMKMFTFICFCIMVSGFGTFLQERFQCHFWIAIVSFVLACFLAFLLKLEGLETINKCLVPLILVGVIFLWVGKTESLVAMKEVDGKVVNYFFVKHWLQAAVLYTGYNSLLFVPILVELREYHLSLLQVKWISGIFSLAIGTIGVLIYMMLAQYDNAILYREMPMLIIAESKNHLLCVFYSIVMMLAIFTTAFSCGYAFLKMNSEKHYFSNCIWICIGSILLARLGFGMLMDVAFPIFGYWGMLQFINLGHQKNKRG